VLISEPDMGIYDAMNKARSLATGDWLLFLGCDDVLKDDISSIVRSLNRPETVYYGDVIRRSQGVVSGGRFSKYRLMNRNFCHQAVFYPRQVYRQYAYSLDYPWLADYAYNIRLYGADIPFVYLNIVVTLYNDKGGSSFGDAAFERDKLRLIRESFGTAYWMIKAIRNVFERIVRFVINRPLPTDRAYKS
jgi:glycosyltransferase involved in cell wall biosynthesis